jgi:hypothetical protein
LGEKEKEKSIIESPEKKISEQSPKESPEGSDNVK